MLVCSVDVSNTASGSTVDPSLDAEWPLISSPCWPEPTSAATCGPLAEMLMESACDWPLPWLQVSSSSRRLLLIGGSVSSPEDIKRCTSAVKTKLQFYICNNNLIFVMNVLIHNYYILRNNDLILIPATCKLHGFKFIFIFLFSLILTFISIKDPPNGSLLTFSSSQVILVWSNTDGLNCGHVSCFQPRMYVAK